MTRIIADISVSLDGFVTGPGPGPDNGLGTGGEALHTWAFPGDPGDPGDRLILHEGSRRRRTAARTTSPGDPMTTAHANEIALGIESSGDDSAPLLLLAGGTTMLSWPGTLCGRLDDVAGGSSGRQPVDAGRIGDRRHGQQGDPGQVPARVTLGRDAVPGAPRRAPGCR